MTTVYFIRHSETFRPENINNSDSMQVQNEKWVITKNGEELAREKSKLKELSDFDIVFSSKYARAICTAKYFTDDKINIDESFGERKFGIEKSYSELPDGFGERQFEDFDYKMENGESLREVRNREEKALNEILNKYKGKKILIVGHSTAMAALFSKWCVINHSGPYYFKDKEFFDGKWNFCETFKLEFDDNNDLISISNIK